MPKNSKDPSSKMGRPPEALHKIDWEEFEKLSSYQCTQEEIADFFQVSADTISRQVQERFGMTFAEFSNKRKNFGRIKLRKAMMELALTGDRVMLIWLSKQYLGMKDKQDDVSEEIMAYVHRAIQLAKLPTEQLRELGKELTAQVVPIHGKA